MSRTVGIRIAGTGVGFPDIRVPNPPDSDEWIKENLGIAFRRHGIESARTSTWAIEAGRNALRDADVDPIDVNMIVLATASPDRLAPATATRVQKALGCEQAFAFDMNAVCSGWLYGLTIASRFIGNNPSTIALVIGADTFSQFTDWERRDSVFFGDGAGAAVVTAGEGAFMSRLHSDGAGWNSWSIQGGGSEWPEENPIWEMVGKDVYDTAIRVVPETVRNLLSGGNWSRLADIDWLVPHQASKRVLVEIARQLEVPWEKVATNLWDYGNTAAASMPTALHMAKDKFSKDELIVFAAVGAGWTWGAGTLIWT